MPIAFLVCILVLVAAYTGWFFLHKQKDSQKFDANGVPAGLEEEYKLAVDPASDGVALMYNLTTCRHCVHLHHFLDKYEIPHHQVYVDKYSGAARTAIMQKLRSMNPRGSFPTLVLPGDKVLVGYREQELKDALGIEE